MENTGYVKYTYWMISKLAKMEDLGKLDLELHYGCHGFVIGFPIVGYSNLLKVFMKAIIGHSNLLTISS